MLIAAAPQTNQTKTNPDHSRASNSPDKWICKKETLFFDWQSLKHKGVGVTVYKLKEEIRNYM